MPRYIDADKLQEEFKELHGGKRSLLIDTEPTADVVEVVRCKDCKHRNKEWYQDKRHKDGGYWLVCCENDAIAERIYGLAQDDDFCSYGERKD